MPDPPLTPPTDEELAWSEWLASDEYRKTYPGAVAEFNRTLALTWEALKAGFLNSYVVRTARRLRARP